MTPVAEYAETTLNHTMDIDVNIFDTDCFGVMWHGAYLKWMEMGRVLLFRERGLEISRPGDPQGYIYPVVEQNLKFRSPAQFRDKLTLTTGLEVDGYRLNFRQVFTSHATGKTTLESSTTVVVLDPDWKLLRRLPDEVLQTLGV